MDEIGKLVVAESKVLAKSVYEDLLQPATREIGTALGRSVHALLFPIYGMCWGVEKIKQIVVNGVEERLKEVPENKRHSPEPEIAVPLIQALTYTAQNDVLREMYINLLANSMNSDFDKKVHPSYVDIIKQMNHLDAVVFADLAKDKKIFIPVITPTITLKGQGKQIYDDGNATLPHWFFGWTIEKFDIFDMSACLVRLARLGLVQLRYDVVTTEIESYDKLKTSPLITTIFEKYVEEQSEMELELTITNNIFYVNEFGIQFAKSCLDEWWFESNPIVDE